MAQRRYRIGCRLAYEVLEPSTFIFNVAATRSRRQRIDQERLDIGPGLDAEEHVDRRTGNRFHRVRVPPSGFRLDYAAEVRHAPRLRDPTRIGNDPSAPLPLALLTYLYPSRYCQSDEFYRLAQREFGHLVSGYAQVTAICDWIHQNIEYLSGSTDEGVSAHDTAISRCGVCRDFTHLAIAFCRALNIPARFVSGYAWGLPQPDFHTALEVWLGGGWYLFDPTRQCSPADFLRIGTGRDAADVSFAFIFGRFSMLDMAVSCAPLDGGSPAPPHLAVAAG